MGKNILNPSAGAGAKEADYFDPLNGANLLDQVDAHLSRFVAFPSDEARHATVLWAAHAHAMDAWESTPRIGFFSPEPGSGKTRCLEVVGTLVPNPVEAVNATPAYLFRKVGEAGEAGNWSTLLFDELDTIFGARAKEHEEIRGLLNAGHRRGACAGRCVVRGKVVETEEIEAYSAVAMAGLGFAPNTIMSRTVAIKMKRRAPNQRVEPFRRRLHVPEGNRLRDDLAAWASLKIELLAIQYPEMPAGVEDRDADVWEPLLAVADEAGGHWPARARVAAVALVAASKESTPSLGVRLLADIRQVMGDDDVIATADLIDRLCDLDESPWADMRGSRIDARKLARLLSPYEVKSTTVRIGSQTPKGYRREELHDAWVRYLSPSSDSDATSATSATVDRSAVSPIEGFD